MAHLGCEHGLGSAEVRHLDLKIFIQNNVCGLEVSVDHVFAPEVGKRVDNLGCVILGHGVAQFF